MALNIAMDGPVGAGKSSVADAAAERLGILHLDTGAMYRAAGLTLTRMGIPLEDEAAVTQAVQGMDIRVSHEADGQHTFVDGEDVTGLIRTEAVSMAASTCGKYGGVRRRMVELQQKLASEQDMLVDGRDICLRVLPNADVKIYLTASAESRAKRRWLQLQEKGSSDTYEQVLADLKKRDDQDMNREVDPLRPTPDAMILDTTDMTFEQSVDAVVAAAEAVRHV